ncbi:Transcriptional regulator ure2 [Coniothyrium glycines]
MSAPLQPITVYGKTGPNPPKVIMILEELGLPYTINPVSFPDLKQPAYLAINPNGRMPAIQDPNTGLTLWESGAIIEYLVERYDVQRKISFAAGSNEGYLVRQWLFFQVSGQGPYYGQAAWFTRYHAEQLESAKTRYYAEIERVTAVLETHLAAQEQQHGTTSDGPWLVGGRLSFADVAFVPWQQMARVFFGDAVDLRRFTRVAGWVDRMLEREAVGKVMREAFEQ